LGACVVRAGLSSTWTILRSHTDFSIVHVTIVDRLGGFVATGTSMCLS
jgi:hypothetical protein